MKEGPQPSVETWKYKASDEGLHGGHLPDDNSLPVANSESQIPHCSYWVTNIHFLFLADYSIFLLMYNNSANLVDLKQ